MTAIRVRAIGGMRPITDPDSLKPGEAVLATNCKLTSGALEAFKALGSTVVTLSGATPVVSVYRYGQLGTDEALYWFQSTVDANFVKGPIDGDTEERTYWTDGVYPKKTKSDIATTGAPYPSASLRMGIPAPTGTITPTTSGSPTNAADPSETVTYCVTYVSTWGEEGPDSVATALATWKPGQTITLTGLPTGPGAGYSIASKNIYRSAVGTTGRTEFQLVANVPLANTSYADTTATANLGATLSTSGWVPPPDNMIGLTAMANGVLAGFFGNTVCFSEPYAPYAWPVRYQRSTDAPIVGIAAFDQSLFVGTTTGVYVFTGTDPNSMTSEKLAVAQSCVSKRSVVEMMKGVVWASPDGLMFISAGGVKNLTEDLMTREQWQAYKPDSFSAYECDNRYIVFYDTGVKQAGLVFTFGSMPTFVETDLYCTAGYRDKKRDALYLVSSGNTVKKWDSGAALTYDWTSGVFHLPLDANMACARVDAESYPVTFKLYADGVLKHTQTVANRYAFWLPAGYRSSRYHVNLNGTPKVRGFEIAESKLELQSG